MGSGLHANAGWQQAAYARDWRVWSQSGPGQHVGPFTHTVSTGYSASISGYDPPWNVTLWYGGPGTG
jgi:hypothetical protein